MTRRLLSCAVLVGLAIACRPGSPAPEARQRPAELAQAPLPSSPSTSDMVVTTPATAPSAGVVAFASPPHGIRLSYPAGWVPVSSQDEEFILVLVHGSSGDARRGPTVSIDVPKLPPHIPGLIPLGMVAKGYVDDLKELHPGVQVTQPAAEKVAGANARRVRATWDEQGTPRVEEAVLAVRGDRVFIFRAVADASEHERAREALTVMLGSVEWK